MVPFQAGLVLEAAIIVVHEITNGALIMFGRKNVYTLANPTEQKKQPSKFLDALILFGISFAFGVMAWYLVRPILGM